MADRLQSHRHAAARPRSRDPDADAPRGHPEPRRVNQRTVVAEGTPAAAFFASFATQEGPVAQYERLRAQGFSDEEIFCEVLTPAQLETGRQWQLNRISVAEEHRRTAVVRELIGRRRDGAPGTATEEFRVVAACTPHERHTVGIASRRSFSPNRTTVKVAAHQQPLLDEPA
ncbi:MAG: B12-binding domain-containing protein [Vulcanimicrobiaceae bacterium]